MSSSPNKRSKLNSEEVLNNKRALKADKPSKSIGSLPLVFANGYPANLDLLSIEQLEKFVTFISRCSNGGDLLTPIHQAPTWWSIRIPFSDPIHRPENYMNYDSEWRFILKSLIEKCYILVRNIFIVGFSKILAEFIDEIEYLNLGDHHIAITLRETGQRIASVRYEALIYDNLEQNQSWIQDNTSSKNLQQFFSPSKDMFMYYLNLERVGVVREDANQSGYNLRSTSHMRRQRKFPLRTCTTTNQPSIKAEFLTESQSGASAIQ